MDWRKERDALCTRQTREVEREMNEPKWTKEAVQSAIREFFEERTKTDDTVAMRSALDAAVKAQGLEVMLFRSRTRAEALEEAALYKALAAIVNSDMAQMAEDEGREIPELSDARAALAKARGE
jgi:hypothetical protein